MTIWFTADTHFSHRNIMKYCDRPFSSVEEMDDHLVTVWNDCVGKRDTVYHLGDVSWRPKENNHVLSRLNGKKILILGNHDKKLGHNFLDHWHDIHDYFHLKLGQTKIVLFHYPIFSWDSHYHGSIHLHGHCHGTLNNVTTGRILDVGVDSIAQLYGEYRPVYWAEVRDRLINVSPKVDAFQKWNKMLETS